MNKFQASYGNQPSSSITINDNNANEDAIKVGLIIFIIASAH